MNTISMPCALVLGLALSSVIGLAAEARETESQSIKSIISEQSMTGSSNKFVTAKDIVSQYAAIGFAVFEDSLFAAESLDKSLQQLIEKPSEANLEAAKLAWKAARVPYMQTEVYRFGNPIVDDWAGQVNAWPLDEALIDYVATDLTHEPGNAGAKANIIANQSVKVGKKTIETSVITPELIATINELGGFDVHVATGYHAIEFLLWGQDLHGFEAGTGERPYTDYLQTKACTGGHCDRRVAYLSAASQLLLKDLSYMVAQWAPADAKNYRATFEKLPTKEALTRIMNGMVSRSVLPGEIMKVALELNSHEDEHDRYSDNTHNSLYFTAKGVDNIYYGRYTRISGDVLKGSSLAEYVQSKNYVLHAKMAQALATTEQKLSVKVNLAEPDSQVNSLIAQAPITFDQMVAPGNKHGELMIRDAINALAVQAQLIEDMAVVFGIENLNPSSEI